MSRVKQKLPHDEVVQLRAGLMKLLVVINETRYGCFVAKEHNAEIAAGKDMTAVRDVLKMVDKYEVKKIDQVYDAFPADKIEVIGP